MKKPFINSFLIAFSLISFGISSSSVYAVSLSIEPSTQTVYLRDSFDVNVDISGLGDGSSLSLGAFDLDLMIFNDSHVSLNTVTFGNQLDFSAGLGSIALDTPPVDVIPGVSVVNIFEVSLEPTTVLNSMQNASFTLATFNFTANSLGTSLFRLDNVVLSDEDGMQITPKDIIRGDVNVIPEPSTYALFGLGLVGLVIGYKRKKSHGA